MERSHGTGEAETFARLMRELKERAGLSYGVLARRLHTSTSTLHRYCNGDALPVEFAVVDRFARACGASAGEAVELHRAWLLADARRRAGVEPQPEPERAVVETPAVRGPWYRRRAVVLAAAGVTAASLALAVVAAMAQGGRGTASAGSVPSGSGPPLASAAAPAPADPVKAAVRSHVWSAGCDHAYLVERGPGAVPPPPVEADAPAWASAVRAVHAGTQIVEVTVHATGPGAVVLEDLEVRVTARRTPPAWNVYQMSQGCGGGLTPAAFAVNLDAPRPLPRPVAGNDADAGGPVAAPAFPLRVSADEPVVLRVEATTTGCDCDWALDLRWTGPSGSGTLRVDDDGRPLRISAATGRPVYGYAMEQGRWGR